MEELHKLASKATWCCTIYKITCKSRLYTSIFFPLNIICECRKNCLLPPLRTLYSFDSYNNCCGCCVEKSSCIQTQHIEAVAPAKIKEYPQNPHQEQETSEIKTRHKLTCEWMSSRQWRLQQGGEKPIPVWWQHLHLSQYPYLAWNEYMYQQHSQLIKSRRLNTIQARTQTHANQACTH